MNERILQLRKHFKLSQEKFGEKLGVTKSAVSRMELGVYNVTDTMLRLMCKEFYVSYEWLKYGTGEMLAKMNRLDEISKLTNQLLHEEEDSFKNRLISALANLSEEQWETLAEIAESLVNKELKDIKPVDSVDKPVDKQTEFAEELALDKCSVEELEKEYKKTLHSASGTNSTVLPTIENTNENKAM